MPIPQKKDNESQNDYMGRCMHFLNKDGETPRPQDQKVAICLNTYSNPKKKAKAEVEIDFTEDIKNMNKPQEIIPIEAPKAQAKVEQATNTAVTAPEVKIEENTASCGKPNCGSVQELKIELITLNDMLDKVKDSDLLNIRDQILGSLNQLKSLLKLV
jgi:hypothetical protein